MNYFAHALRFLDRPWFVAGSAVPDWLSVLDRKVRVRRPAILQKLPELSGDEHECALGIHQHLDDDQWFHGTQAFFEVTGTLGRDFRQALGPSGEWQCGFLGHVVMELLLDSVLIEENPGQLDRYYAALNEVDPQRIEQIVGQVATHEPVDLSRFVVMFQSERFLEDYVDDARLLHRLNQVMRRVGLNRLPETVLPVLHRGRELVRQNQDGLLPESLFPRS